MLHHRTLLAVAVALSAALLDSRLARAELFVDVGMHTTRVEVRYPTPETKPTSTEAGPHFGVGFRRALSRGDIGARLELDTVDSDLLLGVRALDYRFRRSDRLAVGAFIGAARLDLATPAYGYYFGGGVHLRELVGDWDLSAELRYGDKIARDNLLPSDPQGGSPDNFYDLTGVSVYLSRRF